MTTQPGPAAGRKLLPIEEAGEIVLGPETYNVVGSKIPARNKTISTKHEGGLDAWLVNQE